MRITSFYNPCLLALRRSTRTALFHPIWPTPTLHPSLLLRVLECVLCTRTPKRTLLIPRMETRISRTKIGGDKTELVFFFHPTIASSSFSGIACFSWSRTSSASFTRIWASLLRDRHKATPDDVHSLRPDSQTSEQRTDAIHSSDYRVGTGYFGDSLPRLCIGPIYS